MAGAEELARGDDAVARLKQRQQREEHRRHAGRGGATGLRAFECGELLFESRRRWIVRARVEVSIRLPGERTVDRLLLLVRRLKREGGRLVDGEVVRAGGWISPLARMHGDRVDRGFDRFRIRDFGHSKIGDCGTFEAPAMVGDNAMQRALAKAASIRVRPISDVRVFKRPGGVGIADMGQRCRITGKMQLHRQAYQGGGAK